LLAVENNKHLFIEKPLASSSKEARRLIDRSKGSKSIIQVGHIERFNPAFQAAGNICLNPRHIYSKRMAPYNPRANDVSVIHDLMIHDIDAILSVVDSKVDKIHASGSRIITEHLDICEARLVFENGSIANLLASRMHIDQERFMEIQCMDRLLKIDFLHKTCKSFSFVSGDTNQDNKIYDWNTPKGHFKVRENILNFSNSNAILEELLEFYNSIVNDEPIRVDHNDAFRALFIADKIEQIALDSLV
jgi:predicted dehydrogenase